MYHDDDYKWDEALEAYKYYNSIYPDDISVKSKIELIEKAWKLLNIIL